MSLRNYIVGTYKEQKSNTEIEKGQKGSSFLRVALHRMS